MIFVRYLLQAYAVIILARVVLSYFPIRFGSPLEPVVRVVRTLTEPVLGPLRKVMPTVGLGRMAFDFSPLVVLVVIGIIASRLG
ncbi:MAG: YggT family protein [Acidimicrobiales bacterium]|nr:YggT family protein [Acidimicrobiales bacterium]MBO0894695.1 YggT family protein [Acidimicrobiales bacterium]